MKVYNLTDRKPTTVKRRKPKEINVGGKFIAPGSSADVENLTLGAVAGLMRRQIISINHVPRWYQRQINKEVDAKSAEVAKSNKSVDPKEPAATKFYVKKALEGKKVDG